MRKDSLQFLAYFLAALALAVTGQVFAGAYTSDLHWADEGSHYINGLLIHDYLAKGLGQNPVQYAIGYYANYPKVAIGHWPPFFYPLEALFFFITGPSVRAALFLQALLAAGLAASVAFVVARWHGWIAGLCAALLVLLAPDIFSSTLGVMLDIPLALIAFLATLSWARYLDSGDWRWSLGFALLAAAAILTKGNGFFLAFVPPLTLVITRRWDLLRVWHFWLALPLVAVLTVPWYVATYKIAADGFNYSWGFSFIGKALVTYRHVLWVLIGIPGFLAALLGSLRVLQFREPAPEQALGVSALAAAIACFAYHCLVPVALEPRYLVPIIPDLVVLAFFALHWPLPYKSGLAAAAVLAMLVAEPVFAHKPDLGMARAGRMIAETPNQSPLLLVGSTPGGEGAITAEVATDDRSRHFYVLRGFQVLGTGNFMGTRYTPRFAGPEPLRQWVENNHIGWVVLDTSPASLKWQHNQQLRALLAKKPKGWERVAALTNPNASVLVYRIPTAAPANVASLLPQLRPAKVIGKY